MFVSVTNCLNSLFTSLLGHHIPSLHLTAGNGLAGTGYPLLAYKSQHLGTHSSLTLLLGLQRKHGQRWRFICLGSTQTPGRWRQHKHLGK